MVAVIVGLDVADGRYAMAARERGGVEIAVHDGRDALVDLAASGGVHALGVAVADHWLDSEGDGARLLEHLRHDLVERLHLPQPSVVRRSQAAAAWHADRGADLMMVLEPTPDLATAALYHVEPDQVNLLGVGGSRMAGDVGQAVGTAVAESGPAAHRRAASVLPRSRDLPRYRRTPLYGLPGTARYTAGEVLDWYARVESVLADSVGYALPAPCPAGAARIVLTGPLRDFPLLAQAELRQGRFDPRAAAPTAPLIAGPQDCAGGALLLADGSVRAVEHPARFAVQMPVSRVRAGRLRAESVSLHTPTGRSNLAVGWEGVELVVDVDTTRHLTVDVRDTDPAGAASSWTVVLRPRPAPGRYRIGLWAGRLGPGVLVLRPSDGTEPYLFPLSERR